MNLIAVIMKAPTTKIRFSEATKLLNYGFSNFEIKNFGKKGDIIQTVKVDKGIENELNLILKDDANVLIKKGDNGNIEQVITISENITAPINKNDILGKIEYKINEETILEINLIAEKDIAKNTIWNITQNLYVKWFNLMR